jgi:hypothetical protein
MDIDEAVLPSLTHETLKELGVTAVGHRLKLLDAIATLPNGCQLAVEEVASCLWILPAVPPDFCTSRMQTAKVPGTRKHSSTINSPKNGRMVEPAGLHSRRRRRTL